VNENLSYDYLTSRGGFEFNEYQDKLEVGSVYSYNTTIGYRITYIDFNSKSHGVNLEG
jgi:hypothetical protein